MKAVKDRKNGTLTLLECSAQEVLTVLVGLADGRPEVIELLHEVLAKQENIIMTQAEELALVKAIDDTTTKIGVNVTAIGAVADTISTEVDALLVKATNAGSSPEIIAAITALGTKAQSISDATDALVPTLNAIATKGAGNPVPVPVPPPVPVP